MMTLQFVDRVHELLLEDILIFFVYFLLVLPTLLHFHFQRVVLFIVFLFEFLFLYLLQFYNLFITMLS